MLKALPILALFVIMRWHLWLNSGFQSWTQSSSIPFRHSFNLFMFTLMITSFIITKTQGIKLDKLSITSMLNVSYRKRSISCGTTTEVISDMVIKNLTSESESRLGQIPSSFKLQWFTPTANSILCMQRSTFPFCWVNAGLYRSCGVKPGPINR